MFNLMFNLIQRIISLFLPAEPPQLSMSLENKAFLQNTVSFYLTLSNTDKERFEARCLSFINDTEFIGHDLEVSDQDRLLVAAGSVILAWGFPQWHYVKVDTVILVSKSFNENSEFGQNDSRITGLVGTHHMLGKMILAQPALHQGFSNDSDKRNVAIHEFAHLIDMADGDIDGLPEQICDQAFSLPWLNLVQKKVAEIKKNKADIRDYGATNNAEFFSVVSEYFFERPKLLRRRHPELYKQLESFYQQNRADVQKSVRLRKKAPCPCGSGKRYKRCCLNKPASTD